VRNEKRVKHGKELPDMDVRVDRSAPWVVMSLVRGDEELVVGRWSMKRHPQGAEVLWNLGDLRRSGAERLRGT
jgi:hypothetical protein